MSGQGEGQMLLLSALAICVCLIALAALLSSLKATEAPEKYEIGQGELDNIVWAQEAGFAHMAVTMGSYPPEQHQRLAYDFIARADPLSESLTSALLAHGIVRHFAFNQTLAEKYLIDDHVAGVYDANGILIKNVSGAARVGGYAYDMTLANGRSQRAVSKVVIIP